jgi:hypothetical protein
MARTKEQTGLWKPSDRAAQVCAVDGENLELIACDAAHPACGIHGLSVGGHHERIAERREASLALWKLVYVPEWNPGQEAVRASASDRRQQEPSDWHGQHGRYESIEKDSQFHEQPASGERGFVWHHFGSWC